MAGAPNIEIIVGYPDGGDFVRAYLADDERVSRFYGPHFSRLEAFSRKAGEVDARFDRAARERVVEALMVPEAGDPGRLDRFVAEGGYMVTTGQQAGLFGGPLYSVHKALTAVRLAEALEEKLGKPVLPLFWVGSEDHDWQEACQVDIVGVDNELHHLEVSAPDPSLAPALHRVPLTNGAADTVAEFLGLLPTTDFSQEYAGLLRESFGPGKTLVDGYHATLHHLLGRFGIFFTDAAHPVVKRDSSPVLLSELERAEELEGVLRETASEIEAAGFGLQVPILEGSINLFLEGPAGRERLYREGAGFRLHTSGRSLSGDDIRARFEADPLALSPNVLLRPVVESTLFPTLAYVGGPGELAYFGQLRRYFDAHGVSMPVVYPRWAATPVEAKIRKVLDKFGMDVDTMARPFHEIASDLARDEVPSDVRAALGKLRGALGAGMGELKAAAKGVDVTLAGSVQLAGSQVFGAVDDLEKKIVQAVKRQSEISLAQLEKAQVHLYPNGKPTERVQSPFYFLARYGGAVLDGLYQRFSVNLD